MCCPYCEQGDENEYLLSEYSKAFSDLNGLHTMACVWTDEFGPRISFDATLFERDILIARISIRFCQMCGRRLTESGRGRAMNIDILWGLYRQSLRKLNALEQRYKAESDSGKEYACLTFNEMSTQYGVVSGISEAIQAAYETPEQKTAAMRRAFDVFCEETGVPRMRGGAFGFWIPVDDFLPEKGTDVLASFDDGVVASVTYAGDWVLWSNAGEVAAWMPLPEAYRAGNGGEKGREI